MKKALIFLMLTILSSACALDLNLPLSAELAASSGLCLVTTSPLTVLSNPTIHFPGFASSVSHLYNLADLSLFAGAACYAKGKFKFGIGSHSLQHPLWKETEIIGTIAYQFKYFSIGTSIHYLMNQVVDYHNGQTMIYDFAITGRREKTTTTILLKNFTQSRFFDQELPIYLIGEYSYHYNEKLIIALGFEKEREFDFSIKMGTAYQILSNILIITSYQFQPDRLGTGLFFNYRKFTIGISVRTHRYLDLTESVSIDYEIY